MTLWCPVSLPVIDLHTGPDQRPDLGPAFGLLLASLVRSRVVVANPLYHFDASFNLLIVDNVG